MVVASPYLYTLAYPLWALPPCPLRGTGSQKSGLDQEIQHILAIAFLSLGCPLPDRSLVIQLWKHISCYFLALEHS